MGKNNGEKRHSEIAGSNVRKEGNISMEKNAVIGKTATEVEHNLVSSNYYDTAFGKCIKLNMSKRENQVKFLFVACGVYNQYKKSNRSPVIEGRSTQEHVKFVLDKLGLDIEGVVGTDLIDIFSNRPGVNMNFEDKKGCFLALNECIDKITLLKKSKLIEKADKAEKMAEKAKYQYNGDVVKNMEKKYEDEAKKYRKDADNVSRGNVKSLEILFQLRERSGFKFVERIDPKKNNGNNKNNGDDKNKNNGDDKNKNNGDDKNKNDNNESMHKNDN